MTDIIERLHTIRDHLRTGRFGQREVWEEWLTEAVAEIKRLRSLADDMGLTNIESQHEIERLNVEIKRLNWLLREPRG